MIIGIYGKKHSGKDTISDFICQKYDFVKYGFGDPIKEIAAIMFGFTESQLYGNEKEQIDETWGISPREFFQKFGTNYAQFIFPKHFPNIFECGENKRTIWVKVFEKWYLRKIKVNPNLKIVINDIRFNHEYDVIKKMGGYIIKVEREILLNNDYHISENELDNYNDDKFNYIIKNNSSKEDLYNTITNLIN